MSKRIIYKEADGELSIIVPAPKALEQYTIEQIAEKDVPSGLPYRIVEESDVPSDRTFRNAWTIDESELTSGTGAEVNFFEDDPAHPNNIEDAE